MTPAACVPKVLRVPATGTVSQLQTARRHISCERGSGHCSSPAGPDPRRGSQQHPGHLPSAGLLPARQPGPPCQPLLPPWLVQNQRLEDEGKEVKRESPLPLPPASLTFPGVGGGDWTRGKNMVGWGGATGHRTQDRPRPGRPSPRGSGQVQCGSLTGRARPPLGPAPTQEEMDAKGHIMCHACHVGHKLAPCRWRLHCWQSGAPRLLTGRVLAQQQQQPLTRSPCVSNSKPHPRPRQAKHRTDTCAAALQPLAVWGLSGLAVLPPPG